MKRAMIPLAIAALAGTANASFFSFASDNDDQSWTFSGMGGGMFDAADATDALTLLIDDNNGPLAPLELSVEFDADFALTYVASVAIGGGNFLHTYTVDGMFTFDDANSGDQLFQVDFTGAVLTAPGGENSWSSTAAALGSDTFTDVTYTSFVEFADYGVFEGESVGPDDFGFDLTVLNTSGEIPFGDPDALGVDLDPNFLPAAQWWSEGSFSGSATFVPAPGSIALLGLGGLVAFRRKR